MLVLGIIPRCEQILLVGIWGSYSAFLFTCHWLWLLLSYIPRSPSQSEHVSLQMFPPHHPRACWVPLVCIHAALNTLFEIVYWKSCMGNFAVTEKGNKCKTLASRLYYQSDETSNHKALCF